MKFALINGNKVEATKGARGVCPNCGSELIAKCGDHKIDHWAHKANRNCDPWWESETVWHRLWKNFYNPSWQEVGLLDESNNEKHIADVRTSDQLVIEFQHSFINADELSSREKFYKKMVWVVDGTRLIRDYPRFIKGSKEFRNSGTAGVYLVDFLEESFPSNWIGSNVPVLFDFRGTETIEDINDPRQHLYCLLPKNNGRYTMVVTLPRQYFIDSTTNGEWSSIFIPKFEKVNHSQHVQQNVGTQNIRLKRPSQYIFDKGRFVKRRRF